MSKSSPPSGPLSSCSVPYVRSTLASLVAAGVLLAFPANALALGPVDVEIAARDGFGVNPDGGEASNPFGAGFGARAGVIFKGFYGGLSFMDYKGTDASVTTFPMHAFLLGVEAGYGFVLGDAWTIRPQVGVGRLTLSSSYAGPSASIVDAGIESDSNTEHHLYLEPGVTILYGFGNAFVGIDGNVLVVPGVNVDERSAWVTATFHAQLGVKF